VAHQSVESLGKPTADAHMTRKLCYRKDGSAMRARPI